MNTDMKNTEAIPFKPPLNHIEPGYKVCWLHSSNKAGGDIFVGKITFLKFVGNHLTLELTPLARVWLCDKTDWTIGKHWKPLAIEPSTKFEFDGCIRDTKKSSTNRAFYKSSSGETIILSNEDADMEEIREVFP
jgi:hypothetical protein